MNKEMDLNYISDLVEILIEKIEELKNGSEKDDYVKGQIFSYYDTLDTIKSQAELFDIKIDRLDELNLESYLQ